MLMETGGSAAGGPKRGRRADIDGSQSWAKLAQQWLIAIVFLPVIVVAMLIKPEWFTTSDE
ncbi:hypothetical protein SAMN03159496_04442 [Rhizobium sp. NFR07]|uniref:hypothetical protein n=1 Tax=Rhizobium sp. NFR07 TaxID=1566262 RepID=UPI0008ECC506|nr:hypothetical protein [Rhizobium sp. NFR07]SFB50747.1 hypothetical protein SAMN03159496_04442 [Rhizobium sp. NFR07]